MLRPLRTLSYLVTFSLGLGFALLGLPLGELVIEVGTPNTGPFLLEVVRDLAFDKLYLVVRQGLAQQLLTTPSSSSFHFLGLVVLM